MENKALRGQLGLYLLKILKYDKWFSLLIPGHLVFFLLWDVLDGLFCTKKPPVNNK